jgi:hypothetical protein
MENRGDTPTAGCGLFCRSCSSSSGARKTPTAPPPGGPDGPVPRAGPMRGVPKRRALRPLCLLFLRDCAQSRGVPSARLRDYPCEDLKAFQAEKPHRRDLWKDQERIAQIGRRLGGGAGDTVPLPRLRDPDFRLRPSFGAADAIRAVPTWRTPEAVADTWHPGGRPLLRIRERLGSFPRLDPTAAPAGRCPDVRHHAAASTR